uniref:Uncharacterized protein n=1 Tax=Nelumbo nucifera TaxID=4432 RepID=A0A822Z106_NELNU|nr:TPA_asm: hypothetical protein HUJ06_007993 [Nelumbo nucifera]
MSRLCNSYHPDHHSDILKLDDGETTFRL